MFHIFISFSFFFSLFVWFSMSPTALILQYLCHRKAEFPYEYLCYANFIFIWDNFLGAYVQLIRRRHFISESSAELRAGKKSQTLDFWAEFRISVPFSHVNFLFILSLFFPKCVMPVALGFMWNNINGYSAWFF